MSKETSKPVVRAQRRKKIEVVEKFGGKCSLCGYDKCYAALEFHHIENKKESPSYVIHRWSWERAKEELEKCILVCSNCHREIHHGQYNDTDDLLFRINQQPWNEYVCPLCKKTFVSKDVARKFCSSSCQSLSTRKVTRPSKEELEKFLFDKMSFTQLGKMFGVSDNAVRKWAKRYNILSSKKDAV